MAIQTYSGPDLRWFAALIGLMLLRQYLNLSPLLVLLLLLLGVCLCSGRSPASSESFSPVYRPGTCAGLPWGVAAVQGRRPYMEDMFVAAPLRGAGATGVANVAAAEGVGLTHVFAVFDGHGGKRAAQWAHDNLLSNLLAKLAAKAGEASGGDGGGGASNGGSSEDDAAALETASVDAFLQTDAEFLRRATQHHIPDGSTAVCALLQKAGADGATDVLVANLGDSRAALVKRDGAARPISFDHKPNRPDEEARVRAAGGQVIFAGCWRVQGDLAVSRAFGDCHLKRFGVSARPELHRWRLERDDAYLVLASDGLWDVVDEVQCGKVLLRAKDRLEGARALERLATDRGSMDNITVLVVALDALG